MAEQRKMVPIKSTQSKTAGRAMRPGERKGGRFRPMERRRALAGILTFLLALALTLSLSSVPAASAIPASLQAKNEESIFQQMLVEPARAEEGDVPVTRVLARGTRFHSTNGLNFDAQDRLYIASNVGSSITVMDPNSGRILERLGREQGVLVPDDLAFGPDGALYWTGLFTGEVSRITPEGAKERVAQLVPGANAITFSDDGRLFVAQCFFGDGVYEVDPEGVEEPRLITDALGPGCGLNGMDWGPDGFLYGPRYFQAEIVRVDVDSGDFETVVESIGVPIAVKFDSQGRLHLLDTQSGRVIRVDIQTGEQEVVATIVPGLDNLAIDSRDRLFVSSYADSFIAQILMNGTTRMISKGGMTAPGGIAVLSQPDGETVVVADFFSLRAFDARSGKQQFVQRSVIGMSALGFPMTVASDGEKLLLSSWPDNLVQVFDPKTGAILETHRDFAVPLNAIRFNGDLIVAELGTSRVVRADGQNPEVRTTLIEGLGVPAGLAATDQDMWVSDWAAGTVLQIVASGVVLEEPLLVAQQLSLPEGLAVAPDGNLLVVETGAGRLSRIDLATGKVNTVAGGLELGANPPPDAPPTWIFNGVAVGPSGDIYVTGDISNTLYRITPDGR